MAVMNPMAAGMRLAGGSSTTNRLRIVRNSHSCAR